MSLIVLYFLHSTSVLSFYVDVVLTLSILVLCEFTLQLCGFYGASHFCGDPALRMACHGPMVEKG